MQTHWNNIEKEEDNPEFKYFKKFSYRQKLAERKWDFVTIQQASDKSWISKLTVPMHKICAIMLKLMPPPRKCCFTRPGHTGRMTGGSKNLN